MKQNKWTEKKERWKESWDSRDWKGVEWEEGESWKWRTSFCLKTNRYVVVVFLFLWTILHFFSFSHKENFISVEKLNCIVESKLSHLYCISLIQMTFQRWWIKWDLNPQQIDMEYQVCIRIDTTCCSTTIHY